MFGSSFIDTAIGISFVFLLLSLIASTINEMILSSMNMRAKDLLRGLQTLLDDDDATGLVKRIYNHGQVYGLFKGEFDPKSKELPSYIPATNFAGALLDTVRDFATAGAARPGGADTVQQAGEGAHQGEPAADPQSPAAIVKSIWAGAQKLAQNETTAKVGKPLLSMIDTTENDIAKLSKGVERWYNSAMDRVSGWYKHRTQRILFGIGLVLAISLNADTLRIVHQVSRDSTLRQSIVAAAQSAKKPDSKADESVQDQIKDVKEQVSEFQDIGMPLGWSGALLPGRSICTSRPGDCTAPQQAWAWVRIAGGWLLTAIAVSLGAPFWFDLLNKFMVVRSTVKPREKSHEEGGKDKQEAEAAKEKGK